LPHPHLSALQGCIKSGSFIGREERETPSIGDVAFKNEINSEDQTHRDSEYRARPVLDRQQQVGCGVADEVLDLGADFVGIDLVRERDTFYFFEHGRQAGRHVVGKFVQIANYGGKGEKPKSGESPGNREEKDENGAPLKGPQTTSAKAGSGPDDGRENHCSQSADVEQKQNCPQQPREIADYGKCEGKDDVAAQIATPEMLPVRLPFRHSSPIPISNSLLYFSPPKIEPMTPPKIAPPAVLPIWRPSTRGRYSLI